VIVTGGRAPRGERPRWLRASAIAVGLLVAVAAVLAAGGTSFLSNLAHLITERGCGFPLKSAPSAPYDEQLSLIQGGSSESLAFVVEAIAQSDSNGYGPAYLVNGLSSKGYWYQVGVAYDWGCGAGYISGFHYFSEVWNASGGSVSGPNFLPLTVANGDSVNLSIGFSGSSIVMSAEDLVNGATQSTNFSAELATYFVGGASGDPQEPGWFTGIMTEWYHVQAYYGGESSVRYTSTTPFPYEATNGVTLGIDELEVPGGELFDQTQFVQITCSCSYPFSYQNATEVVGPNWFQTGGFVG